MIDPPTITDDMIDKARQFFSMPDDVSSDDISVWMFKAIKRCELFTGRIYTSWDELPAPLRTGILRHVAALFCVEYNLLPTVLDLWRPFVRANSREV